MVDRIINAIQQKGMSINAVEKKLGFGNGAIKRFNNSSPSIDKIIKLSNFLNVSLEWIVTGKEPINNIAEDEHELLSLYRSLPVCVQREVLSYIKGSCAALSAVYSSENTQKKQAKAKILPFLPKRK